MGQIDAALTRLLTARMAMGLFDPPNSTVYDMLGDKDVMSQPHRDQALSMSRKALLLLKNDNELLPLQFNAMPKKRIAVIGWGANDTYAPLGNYMGCGHDSWSPRLTNCSIVTPLAGITAQYTPLGFDVIYERGCDPESNSTDGFAAAVVAAASADVVVFVGGNRNCEGGQGHGGAHCESEGHDRPDLEMPGVQTQLMQALYAVNKNVVLAALAGGPISMNWEAEHLPAIVIIWYGGQQMGTALADALHGTASPAGRSPYTWVTGLEQLPDELEMSVVAKPGRTYRHLDGTPLYAFGYGMSYGQFQYTSARVAPAMLTAHAANVDGATVAVCAEVKNIKAASTLASEEVVQVYAMPGADVSAAAAQPPRALLLGFVRTEVFAPGDTATICLNIRLADLRLTSAAGGASATAADYKVLAGVYTFTVGGRGPGAVGVHVGAAGKSMAGIPSAPLEVEFEIVPP